MSVPSGGLGVIATELDAVGVKVVGKVACTSVQAAPAYDRGLFIGTIREHFNADPAIAAAFADDVQAQKQRTMNGPPAVIATELDAAGVKWHYASM